MDSETWTTFHFCMTSAVAIFTVLNPFHAIPLYLGMAPDQTREQKNHVARLAGLTTFIAMVLALFFGDDVLAFFGITIAAFKAGSGIVLGMLALSMVGGQVSPIKVVPEETAEVAHWSSIAVVPLGTPILAGGGVLSTVILLAHEAMRLSETLALLAAIVLNAAGAWGLLRLSRRIQRLFGTTGINIVTRLMGLILMALAVEFVVGGVRELFESPRGSGLHGR